MRGRFALGAGQGTGGYGAWARFGFPVLVVLSLATAGLADFLFYKHVIGWTLGGFVAWLFAFILIRHGKTLLTGRHRAWGWALSLMTAGLCVSLVLEPGVLAWLLALVALGSLVMLARGGWSDAGLGWAWLGRLLGTWAFVFVRPILDSRLARRWHQRTATLRGRIAAAGRLVWAVAGVVVPLVLSLMFLGLFALANPVVADWMGRGFEHVFDFLFNATEYITVSRVLIWYLAGFACWGVLRHRPRRRRVVRALSFHAPTVIEPPIDQADHPVQTAAQHKRAMHDDVTPGDADDHGLVLETESEAETGFDAEAEAQSPDVIAWLAVQYRNLIVRCLIAMNAVFAVQLVLDSRYLVLGDQLPDGMSYAEYAHRGAYPLIATAILAAAMVLAVFRPGGVAQRSAWARRLVILWIAQNVVLVASAAWRLQAYVELYTLTRLRVAAAVWMLMVAGCLALLLWRIARQRDNTWLTGWAMGWGLCVLWVCSFVPFDPMIATYNVMNCKELGGKAGPIDVGYLEVLGTDALPAVDYLIANLSADYDKLPSATVIEPTPIVDVQFASRRGIAEYEARGTANAAQPMLGSRLKTLRTDLAGQLDQDLDDWRGWTVRRAWLSQSSGE